MGGERSEQWSGLGDCQEARGSREIWGVHLGDVMCGIPGNPLEEVCNKAPVILQEKDVLFSMPCCWRLGHGGDGGGGGGGTSLCLGYLPRTLQAGKGAQGESLSTNHSPGGQEAPTPALPPTPISELSEVPMSSPSLRPCLSGLTSPPVRDPPSNRGIKCSRNP